MTVVTPAPLLITPLRLAKRFEGVRERAGKATHPLIRWWLSLCDGMGEGQDDEVPWCSGFVNGIAFELDLPRSRRANARSWLNVGRPIDLDEAQPGFDVAVFWRGEVSGWQGHVGFYEGRSGLGDVVLFGGNQGGRVCTDIYPKGRLLGVRRLSP